MHIGIGLNFTRSGGGSGDVTPPSVTIDAASDTQFDYTTNEAGTGYYLINTSSTPLSGAAIAAGGGDLSGNFAVTVGTSTKAIDTTSLATNTYYLHLTVKDAAGNYSADVPQSFSHTASPLTFIGDGWVGSTGAATTHTFSNVLRVGNTVLPATYAAGKYVVLVGSTSTVTSVTIDGTAATQRAALTPASTLYAYDADIAGGGTGTISIVVGASTTTIAIAVWKIPAGKTFQLATTQLNNASPTNLVLDTNTTAGWCAVCARFSGSITPPDSTWTGLTEVTPDIAVPTTTPQRSFSAASTASVAGGTPEQFRCALSVAFINALGVVAVYG